MSENLSSRLNDHSQPSPFLGEVFNRSHFSGLTLSEIKHEKGRKLPEHFHQSANLYLLIDGSYSEYCGREAFTSRPLTIIFHPPQLVHRDEIGKLGAHFFNVQIGSDWMERLREWSHLLGTVIGFEGGELAWLALRLYREFKSSEPYSDLAVEGLMMTMMAELCRNRITSERREPKWLAKAVDLLRAEFHRSLTVTRVAAEVGVHPFHLAKVFRQFHRQTIGDYVKRLRVDFACRELLNSKTELASVALAAGFSDQSHFSRTFKQATGMTPGAFRISTKAGRDHEREEI